ncbi:hypothetical protein J6590_082375 [Homalodisca vitripennis]|nr:hypothetical protein J6590_082375 [Homalodisca vitripennis]
MTSPTRSPFSNPFKIRRRGSLFSPQAAYWTHAAARIPPQYMNSFHTYTRLLVILDSPLPWPRTSTTPFYETPPRYITSRFYFGYTAVTALPQRPYRGKFKYLFLVEILCGTLTASLEDGGQVLWRKLYSVMLLGVFLINTTLLVHLVPEAVSESFKRFIIIFRVLQMSFVVYCYIFAVWDSKTKMASALNLQAVENLLRYENHTVPSDSAGIAVLLQLFAIGATQMLHNLLRQEVTLVGLPVIQMVMIFIQINCVKWSQLLTCAGFLLKSLKLNKAINNGFDNLCDEYNRTTHDVVGLPRRDLRKDGSTDSIKRLNFLKHTQGSLNHTENTINAWYNIYVVCFAIFSAIVTPMYGFVYLKSGINISINWLFRVSIVNTIYILMVVVLSENIRDEKVVTFLKLSKLMQRSRDKQHHKTIKHQLLAKHHRDSPFFLCHFFTVDYLLLINILDTSLMVICAM